MTNYSDLINSLRVCAEGNNCGLCREWPVKVGGGLNRCQEELCYAAADAIEELQSLIPHNCFCCVGCETEPSDGSGCDNAFVLSIGRAKEYIQHMQEKVRNPFGLSGADLEFFQKSEEFFRYYNEKYGRGMWAEGDGNARENCASNPT